MDLVNSRHLQLTHTDRYFNNHKVYTLRKQTKEKKKEKKNHKKLPVILLSVD
jgi:hypothetical protein